MEELRSDDPSDATWESNPTAVEKLSCHEAFLFIVREELITHERVELLSSWKHRTAPPPDAAALWGFSGLI